MKLLKGLCVLSILLIYTPSNKGYAQGNPADAPPELIQNPGRYYNYSPDSRKFTGISSMAISKNGQMWAVWYAGPTPTEDKNNYVVVSTSEDYGASWEEVLAIDPDGSGPVRAFDPQIWVDPNGKLWVFWAQTINHQGKIAGVWAITTDDPENKSSNWSSPTRVSDGIMMNKPTVLSDGRWALPVATWGTHNSAKMITISDKGKTFHLQGGCNIPKDLRNADEHMIVERQDQSLGMLVRVKGQKDQNGIMECRSDDGGKTWTNEGFSDIKHPTARFFIRRLDSGNLLLVKHGPISEKIGRSHLMAFISKDDGETWSKGLLLGERNGMSYPDGVQTGDGTIYITFDYSRWGAQKIFMTSFTEEDVLSEKYDENIVKVFGNRKVISDGGRN